MMGYFNKVEEKDHGDYTCTRHYLFQDQLYNMTFSMALVVKPNGMPAHLCRSPYSLMVMS